MTMRQLLRGPSLEPTGEIIAAGLGAASGAYAAFIEGLGSYGITLMDWRYYNDGKAWLSKGEYKWTTPRGANKVKPVFWLSLWEGFFRITFFFSISVQAELLSLPISEDARALIQNAKPMGKTMRFIPVVMDIKADQQLSDVYTIAEYRKAR